MYEEIKVTLTYADGTKKTELWCETSGQPSDYEETFTAEELQYWLIENVKTSHHYDTVVKFHAVDTIYNDDDSLAKMTEASYYRN